MKKLLFFLLLFSSLEAKIPVLVSIPPQKYLVDRIGGDTVEVEVIVPPGASPHSYEPTLHQILRAKKSVLWFRLGEGFEKRLVDSLTGCTIIDQRQGIDLITTPCCSLDAHDPHIWLSPRLLKNQAHQITAALSEKNPENVLIYQHNHEVLSSELEKLDEEISHLLKNKKGTTILVSHPAFGYLCRDYGLEQLPIEMEGREPTPRYLSLLLQTAHEKNIRTVFLQRQYNVKGGQRVAQELHARVIFLDPYAENLLENIKEIAQAFAASP